MNVRRKYFYWKQWGLAIELADDGKWDWHSDKGDRHAEYLAAAIIHRAGMPALFRLSVGPVQIMVAKALKEWGDDKEDQ